MAIYTCCECGKQSPWVRGWRWMHGINPVNDGITCSGRCEDKALARIAKDGPREAKS